MRKTVELFVKYPILANAIIVLTVLAGLFAFFQTNKSFFPLRSQRDITIQVVYPGASPEEMEEGVTLKIEQVISNIVGIDEINSTSSENFATINIRTLKNYDIDEVFTEIKNAVDGISSFPVDAEKPVIFKRKPQSTTQWLGITGDVSLYTLKKYAEEIEDDFIASGIISNVSLFGFNNREISIEVSEDNLLRYGLTFDQVANAVRTNNRDISAGSIKSKEEEILIRSNAKESDPQRIGEIVLRSNPDGTRLLLRDVASSIKEQFSETPNKATLNGKETVFIRIDKLEEQDLEEISKFVNNYVKDFNKKHSAVKLDITYDFMDMLGQRLDMLFNNAAIGLLLVLVALGIFLNLRLSFWVAWGIPSSFLGLFIVGMFFGFTINMISLFGMIVVIGILVDDGIVIAENIYAHFEKTGNPIKSAVDGTMEVLPAVFTSVLTTIIAFSPLLLLSGGFEFLSDIGFVVIATLSFSLLEAFFVLPAHLASKHILKEKNKENFGTKIRSYIENAIDFLRHKVYGKTLRYFLKYRVISLFILIAFFPITIGLLGGGFIRSTFFPDIPFSSFNVDVSFKPGTREQKVEETLKYFEDKIWEVNEELKTKYNDTTDYIRYTFGNVGSNSMESGSHAGNINVFHRELDKTPINDKELIEIVRSKIGDIPEAERFTIGGNNRFGKPVSIKLLSKNNAELDSARNFLEKKLSEFSELKEIQDDMPVGRNEMNFELTPKAYFLGLTHNDITRQVRQGFFGEEVQRLQKGTDEVRVWVRYPESDRRTIGQLENMKIKAANSQEYPLHELVNYSVERGVAGIKHFNTARSVSVEAELTDPNGDAPAINQRIQDEVMPELKAKYPGIKTEAGGQAREAQRSAGEMLTYFGIAFLVIFFVIIIAFKSFYQAILIVTMIPLGWLGATWGHGIEGVPISLLSIWGFIALSGVIINDAVVFLSKFNSNLKEGMPVFEAIHDAAVSRFRAIMLTSITTVVGLYPLILEKSFQAQFLIPMAVSVAYGVMIGTIFILLFFPVLILIFNDMRRAIKWLWTGKKPSPEEVERVIIDQNKIAEFETVVRKSQDNNGHEHYTETLATEI